ncbi:hypothetical protein [Arthrobacter sp. NPDC058127]|uniref:hypothetical protein n=1 Tax=Arthrobacter sp. NPDC058127 TaxID=3346351 RepID=UPI0036E5E370
MKMDGCGGFGREASSTVTDTQNDAINRAKTVVGGGEVGGHGKIRAAGTVKAGERSAHY